MLFQGFKRDLSSMVPKAVAGTGKENEISGKSDPIRSDAWKKHCKYWKKIAVFAEAHKFPILFFCCQCRGR